MNVKSNKSRWPAGIAALLACGLVATAGTPAGPLPFPTDSARVTPSVRAVARVLPAVVNISTERIVVQRYGRRRGFDPFSDFFEEFFGRATRYREVQVPNSLGSGVIVDPRGLMITNDHVIQKASRIFVTLSDGTKYDAVRVAHDEVNDVALLQLVDVPADAPLTAIDFALPGDLLLGERVITVGNPFGLGHSVTEGVLSAAGRKVTHGDEVLFDDILQTDAAINPGNSGGPLVNADGQLIGINLAMKRGAENIGFAIPVERVADLLSHWLIPARFRLATCGLIPGTEVAADRTSAVVVRQLLPATPAAQSGLTKGDVITAFNGRQVRQALDMGRMLWRLKAGDTVQLTRRGKAPVRFTVAELPVLSGEELVRSKLQVQLQELTPRLAAALGLTYTRGLVVATVDKGSVLAKRGVQRGDLIIQIGEIPVRTLTDVARALADVRHGDVLEMVVDRIVYYKGYSQLNRYLIDVPF